MSTQNKITKTIDGREVSFTARIFPWGRQVNFSVKNGGGAAALGWGEALTLAREYVALANEKDVRKN